MFLTAYNIAHYLMARGLVTEASIVAGDFIVVEAGRRNRNFKILRRGEPGLFVKQVKSTEPQALATIDREAIFCKAVFTDPRYAAIRPLFAAYVDYEPKRHALTVRLVENADTLYERNLRAGFPEDCARLLGRSLAEVHGHASTAMADAALQPLLLFQMPWPLMLDQTMLDRTGTGATRSFGQPGDQLTSALAQFPALPARLGALRAEWRHDSLIHNDMKWDNCLIRESGGPQITIADWELVDIGDGAWDVAGIFKEYIATAILTAQATPPLTIEAMQPSAKAFWNAYADGRQIPGALRFLYLERAMRFVAPRLVVAVLEYSFGRPGLTPAATTMLKIAENILDAPRVAVMQLLGSAA